MFSPCYPISESGLRENGYTPSASGVIEGACRHILKDRLEQGGMRWTLPGAAAMLNVRAVCASSAWAAFHSGRPSENRKTTHKNQDVVASYAGFKA